MILIVSSIAASLIILGFDIFLSFRLLLVIIPNNYLDLLLLIKVLTSPVGIPRASPNASMPSISS